MARVARSELVGPAGTTVSDPRDHAPIAVVGSAPEAVATRAVDLAEAAGPVWAETRGGERSGALRLVATRLRANADSLAATICSETGKIRREAYAEVELAARYLEWFASQALAERPEPDVSGQALVRRVPVGVVAAVTPWNFPLSIPVRKLGAALAAGCSVVLKPSPLAPITALELVRLCDDVLPVGALGLVLGDDTQAQVLVDHAAVRAVSFTGSTSNGIDLARRLAGRLTRSVLELGGRAPVIVLPDADLDEAADVVMVAKFRNNGASCIAANNVFVHEAIQRRLLDRLADRVRGMSPGDPWDNASRLGPLRTARQASRIAGLAEQAAGNGCRVVHGPTTDGLSDCYAPATLVEADRACAAWACELFGPLLQVRGYRREDEVVAEVNSWRQGLGGYVLAGDPDRATDVARSLRIGLVGIGTGTPNTPELPFGGFDLAGWAREGSRSGLDAFTEQQAIAFSPTPSTRKDDR